jgi:hypothetical protein
MSYYLIVAINLSILIPAFIGLVRFKKVDQAFIPFLVVIWTGAINEIFSVIIIQMGYYNIISYNIYLLIESFILLWVFKAWQVFKSQSKSYLFLWFILALTWTSETIFRTKLYQKFNSYFIIVKAFIIVLISITLINSLLVKEKKVLVKNSIFLICCAFIFYYTLSGLTEIFYAYGLQLSKGFRMAVGYTGVWANFVSNAIYALAIWWMPRRQAFALQY